MPDTEVDQIISTIDPQKPPRSTPADIVSPEDYFAKCSPAFSPVLVDGATDAKGQPVYVAKLSAAGLDTYFKELDGVPEAESRGAMLAFAIVRANGTRIFAASDRIHLSQFPADETQDIAGAFLEANRLGARKK